MSHDGMVEMCALSLLNLTMCLISQCQNNKSTKNLEKKHVSPIYLDIL